MRLAIAILAILAGLFLFSPMLLAFAVVGLYRIGTVLYDWFTDYRSQFFWKEIFNA